MVRDPTVAAIHVAMKTLADLTGVTGRLADEHLALDLEIPVSDGIQAQGDHRSVPHALEVPRVRFVAD
jgi:hypothetical protein